MANSPRGELATGVRPNLGQVHGSLVAYRRVYTCTPSDSGTNTRVSSPSAVTWWNPGAAGPSLMFVTNRFAVALMTMTVGGANCGSGGGPAAPASAA